MFRETRQAAANSRSAEADSDVDSDGDQVMLVTPGRRSFTSPSADALLDKTTPTKRRWIVDDSDDYSQEPNKKQATAPETKDGVESSESGFGSADERDLLELADRVEAATPAPAPAPPATPTARRTSLAVTTPRTPVAALRNKLLIASEGRPAAHQQPRQATTPAEKTTPTRPAPATMPAAATKTRDIFGPNTPRSSVSSPSSGGDNLNFTPEVMKLLQDQPISASVREAVRRQLDLCTLRVKGIAAGRDMARSVARAKDDKLKELEERLAALEKQRRI